MAFTAILTRVPPPSAPDSLGMPAQVASADAAPEARPCCSTCRLRHHCLPATLDTAETEALDGLMIGRRRVRAGQTLLVEGGRFQFLYAVFAGSFKSTIALKDGRIAFDGPPAELMSGRLLSDLYGIDIRLLPHPDDAHPIAIVA